MSAEQIIELTATQAVAAVRSGDLDPAELFEAYRCRARDHGPDGDGDINCFTWLSDAADGRAAAAGEAAQGPAEDEAPPVPPRDGPLAGVPLAVKDLFCTQGVPSQSGSKILAGYRPPYTATAVARLEAAGARLLGKTNQDEFAMGSSNENSAFGPVRNPWDRSRVPGGSSGGSAAAVAAGLAPWALGTDTGGSIRQPAALCGIVGLKPTYGAVSRYGMIAFASSLDQAGPLTRNVADAALLFGHMVGRDERDATSLPFPEPIAIPDGVRLDGVRLGVAAELSAQGGSPEGGIEPGVAAAFERTLQLARELGASVKTVELPHAPHALAAYYVLAPAEASSNLARFDGVRYGLRVEREEREPVRPSDAGEGGGREAGGPEEPGGPFDDDRGLLRMYTRTRHDGFGSEVKRRIMLGTYALSAGYYEAYYGRAQRVRTKIAEDFRRAFEQVDLIVTPTSAGVAFELGALTGDPWAMYLNDYFTVPMSLAGIPAISIPCGLAGKGLGPGGRGLPVGFQIAGPAFSENRILQAAHALERAIGFDGTAAFA
jgi:aspartyl-tRNA(Asn)/glutamyl-tRNA(Gln) amidotransferase subunit A